MQNNGLAVIRQTPFFKSEFSAELKLKNSVATELTFLK